VKVLLDHNLPHKLRTNLGKHEIVTASHMAEDSGIEVFVTGDRSLADEQNLLGRRLAIVALSANNWPIIKDHVPRILSAIESAVPGSFQEVDCGRFSRKTISDR
jgi:hypothetical protein